MYSTYSKEQRSNNNLRGSATPGPGSYRIVSEFGRYGGERNFAS